MLILRKVFISNQEVLCPHNKEKVKVSDNLLIWKVANNTVSVIFPVLYQFASKYFEASITHMVVHV